MFVILLAQFNSLYNSVVVLLAVIMSVTGVLIGMLVMDQTFSIIMTGTGVVAGLAPMMFGISVDFFNGGYTVDAPTALWWKQLATAVVFGLGLATILTLIVTPALLAVRVWVTKGAKAEDIAWVDGSFQTEKSAPSKRKTHLPPHAAE